MPRKDPALHLIQGTHSQAVLPGQSAVRAGKPRIPKNLNPAARRAFKEASSALAARGALTPGDAALLAVYATLVARRELAQAAVDAEGLVVSYTRLNSNGEEVQTQKSNLNLKIAQDCERQIVAILDRLGLTPRHRDSVKPAGPKRSKPATVPGSVAWELEQAAQQKTDQESPSQDAVDFSDVEDVEI